MLSKIISSALIFGLLLVQVEAEKSCDELEPVKAKLFTKTEILMINEAIHSLVVEATSNFCPSDGHYKVEILKDMKQIQEVVCSDKRYEELARLKHFLTLQGYPQLIKYLDDQRSEHVFKCKNDMIKHPNCEFNDFCTDKLASAIFMEKFVKDKRRLRVKPINFRESFARVFIESRGTKIDQLNSHLKKKILADLQDAVKKCRKFERNLGYHYKFILLVDQEKELAIFDKPSQDLIKVAKMCEYFDDYNDIDGTIIWDQLAIHSKVIEKLFYKHKLELFSTLEYLFDKFEKKCTKAKECDLKRLISLSHNIFAGKQSMDDYNLGVNSSDFDGGFIEYFLSLHPESKSEPKRELIETELNAITNVCHIAWTEMKKMRKIMVGFTYQDQIEGLNLFTQHWIKNFKVCEFVLPILQGSNSGIWRVDEIVNGLIYKKKYFVSQKVN